MNRWWLLMFAAVFAWSAIRPADYPTWFLEVLPAMLGLLVLLLTRRTFPCLLYTSDAADEYQRV